MGGMQSSVTPNDPSYKAQWYLEDIKADQAWAYENGQQRNYPIIMVMDSGADVDHEDLHQNLWFNRAEYVGKDGVDDDSKCVHTHVCAYTQGCVHTHMCIHADNGLVDDVYGASFSDTPPGDVSDNSGHGTHCLGNIGAMTNNQVGVAGVHWGPRLLVCKFIRANGIVGIHMFLLEHTYLYMHTTVGLLGRRREVYRLRSEGGRSWCLVLLRRRWRGHGVQKLARGSWYQSEHGIFVCVWEQRVQL